MREINENDNKIIRHINARVTQEEYEQILNNAKLSGKILAGYIREVTINRAVININYDAILNYTKVINTLKTEIHLIITMLIQTKQAYPSDIQKMNSLLEEISQNQKKMLQHTQRESQGIRKYIKKLLLGNNRRTGNDL